jgi:hypothetical protein
MVRKMKHIGLLLLVALSISPARAQMLSPADLDTAKVYTSMEGAMKYPELVLRLDLSKQKLGSIPDDVFRLNNLQELRMDKCRLSELPDGFNAFPLLQSLRLQHNEIDSIPPTIFGLKHLRILDVADNIVECIPDEIDQLTSLETLAIWDNPITYYPERLTEMQQLKVLDVLNNAMSRETQQRLKVGLPNCRIVMSPPCACMDGGQ